jgi:hypothetical protein
MTPEQRESAIEIIVDEIYGHNARTEGDMNPSACGMSSYMAGLGYGENDIRRALKRYERGGHRQFRNDREIKDIIDFGFRHADHKAIPPWKYLNKVKV